MDLNVELITNREIVGIDNLSVLSKLTSNSISKQVPDIRFRPIFQVSAYNRIMIRGFEIEVYIHVLTSKEERVMIQHIYPDIGDPLYSLCEYTNLQDVVLSFRMFLGNQYPYSFPYYSYDGFSYFYCLPFSDIDEYITHKTNSYNSYLLDSHSVIPPLPELNTMECLVYDKNMFRDFIIDMYGVLYHQVRGDIYDSFVTKHR